MPKIKIKNSIEGYNLAAKNYDKKEAFLNSFEQSKLVPLLGDITSKKILDVGAGTGRISVELARRGADVTALDVSKEMLNILKLKNSHIKTVVGDGEHIPFEQNTFDVVVAAFFIVHLKNPTYFFEEAYRVLKPGGVLVVTNINQKEPPEVKTAEGMIKIESYYHRPEKIIESLNKVAFLVEKEIFVKEQDVWINQIVIAVK